MSTAKVGGEAFQRLGARQRVTGTDRSGRSQASQAFTPERAWCCGGDVMVTPITRAER